MRIQILTIYKDLKTMKPIPSLVKPILKSLKPRNSTVESFKVLTKKLPQSITSINTQHRLI